MSNSDIVRRIGALPLINQCKATPKILKLRGKVGIGLDLMYKRLSSRLRMQIRCSTLIINLLINRYYNHLRNH